MWKIGGGRRRRRHRRQRRRAERKARWRPSGKPGGTGGAPRRARPLRALAFAGLGLGAGYVVSTTLVFPSPEPPPALQGVPELRGILSPEASALLSDSGLAAGRADSVRHPHAPAGMVIGQSPLPGRTALPGAEVRLTVSLGPEIRSVPDVTRLRGLRAVAALEAGGFVVRVDTVESEVPAGRVLAVDPAPGTRIPMPGNVRLAVSLGPPTFPMPELSGFGEDEARSLLDALGLILTTVEKRFSILNVNTVFGQHPEAYASVRTGTAVRLVVGEDVFRVRPDPAGPALSSSEPHDGPPGGD